MSGEVDRVYIAIGAELDEFDSGIDKVQDRLEGLQRDVSGIKIDPFKDMDLSAFDAVSAKADNLAQEMTQAGQEWRRSTAQVGVDAEQAWNAADRGSKKFMGGLRDIMSTANGVVLGLSMIPGVMDDSTRAMAGTVMMAGNIGVGVLQAVQGITDLREGAQSFMKIIPGIASSLTSALASPWAPALIGIAAVVAALAIIEVKTGAVSKAWALVAKEIDGAGNAVDKLTAKIEKSDPTAIADVWNNYFLQAELAMKGIDSILDILGGKQAAYTKSIADAHKKDLESMQGLIKTEIGATEEQWAKMLPTIKENEGAVRAFAAAHSGLEAAQKQVADLQSAYDALWGGISKVQDIDERSRVIGVEVAEAGFEQVDAKKAYSDALRELDPKVRAYHNAIINNETSSIKLTKEQIVELKKIDDLYVKYQSSQSKIVDLGDELRRQDEDRAIAFEKLQQAAEAQGQTLGTNLEDYKRLAETVGDSLASSLTSFDIANDKFEAIKASWEQGIVVPVTFVGLDGAQMPAFGGGLPTGTGTGKTPEQIAVVPTPKSDITKALETLVQTYQPPHPASTNEQAAKEELARLDAGASVNPNNPFYGDYVEQVKAGYAGDYKAYLGLAATKSLSKLTYIADVGGGVSAAVGGGAVPQTAYLGGGGTLSGGRGYNPADFEKLYWDAQLKMYIGALTEASGGGTVALSVEEYKRLGGTLEENTKVAQEASVAIEQATSKTEQLAQSLKETVPAATVATSAIDRVADSVQQVATASTQVKDQVVAAMSEMAGQVGTIMDAVVAKAAQASSAAMSNLSGAFVSQPGFAQYDQSFMPAADAPSYAGGAVVPVQFAPDPTSAAWAGSMMGAITAEEAAKYLPHSLAEKGPFSKPLDWETVLVEPYKVAMDDIIKLTDLAGSELYSYLETLVNPLSNIAEESPNLLAIVARIQMARAAAASATPATPGTPGTGTGTGTTPISNPGGSGGSGGLCPFNIGQDAAGNISLCDPSFSLLLPGMDSRFSSPEIALPASKTGSAGVAAAKIQIATSTRIDTVDPKFMQATPATINDNRTLSIQNLNLSKDYPMNQMIQDSGFAPGIQDQTRNDERLRALGV